MTRKIVSAWFATIAVGTLALASGGCGYRIVRNSDVTAKRFAQDSARMTTMRNEFIALQMQCHADSVQLESRLVAQRESAIAAAAASPQSDSLLKARNVELAALKEQLAKVNAELDRIKRRLANPRG